MMNNRKVINGLLEKIEYLENRNGVLKIVNKDLLKEIEQKDLKICELNTKLCRAEGKLDKIKNMYRMLTGEDMK